MVSISTALLPNPNSVSAKQPITLKSSTPSAIGLCLNDPNVITVPPNKLYYTVIFVANEPSEYPAIS